MCASLSSLPVELQLRIIQFLENGEKGPFDDLVGLSCTCSSYRDHLAPRMFETLELRNTEKSGRSVRAIACSPHKGHVQRLLYKGLLICQDPMDNELPDEKDPEEDLKDTVEDALSSLTSFPNLSTLRVEFEFQENDSWYPDSSYCAFLWEEDDYSLVEWEKKQAWRSLMSRSFRAIAQNAGSSIKHLEVAEFIAKDLTALHEIKVHSFLRGIESFYLSIKGGDNGAGWEVNKAEGYMSIMEQLDEIFFDRMLNLTHLTVVAPDSGPLGLEGVSHIPLPLSKHQMPHLTDLHLHTMFIGPEIISFLSGHKGVLEELKLTNCFASPPEFNSMAENGVTWAKFFTRIRAIEMQRLRSFELSPNLAPLTRRDRYPGSHEEGDGETNETRQIRKTLKEDPNRRIFAYATLDDKYGMLFEDEKGNVESFLDGDDQRAYDALMQDVERRRNVEGKQKAA